ncbi:hypothetical protein CNMCM5793_000247 [Aspergillus hiratsukae]|uniref:Zn(2)-C6 fungal-type domain-containing protein n=1 Tax=Aspergillus hiratsukae TaxID=1194566 RepID=A0A8H6Q0N6_9EURO|nr:hypothetical protein CNMCM5793_000247 [Aspergillus hiratsukae]KAF7163629.1 hypothetical protein CNMCM6106_000484 [Aspergillus hiratsukae]
MRLSLVRSCTFCRSRKVKCDRKRPCANGVRTGTECVYPSGPGRAPKRPRQGLDTRVLDRLSRPEGLLRRLETEVEKGRTPALTTSPEAAIPSIPSSGDGSSQVEQQFGRLVIDDTRSCYVSNILWASLGDEIEALCDLLLYEPVSEADERDDDIHVPDPSVADSTTSPGSNAGIMDFKLWRTHCARTTHHHHSR